jgi:hypothetical protein
MWEGGAGARMWHSRAKLKCAGMLVVGGGGASGTGRQRCAGMRAGQAGRRGLAGSGAGGTHGLSRDARTIREGKRYCTGAQACRKGEGSDGERARGEGRAEMLGWGGVGSLRKEAHLGI